MQAGHLTKHKCVSTLVIGQHQFLLKRGLKPVDRASRLPVPVAVGTDHVNLAGAPVFFALKKRNADPVSGKRNLILHKKPCGLIDNPFACCSAELDVMVELFCIAQNLAVFHER